MTAGAQTRPRAAPTASRSGGDAVDRSGRAAAPASPRGSPDSGAGTRLSRVAPARRGEVRLSSRVAPLTGALLSALAGGLAACGAPPQLDRYAASRFTPAETAAWAAASPHSCSTASGARLSYAFRDDGTFSDGAREGLWRIDEDGALCLTYERGVESCRVVSRSQYGVALDLKFGEGSLGAQLGEDLRHPNAGRATCSRPSPV